MKTIDWLLLNKDDIISTKQIPGGFGNLVQFTFKDGSIMKLDQGITDIEFISNNEVDNLLSNFFKKFN